jgi:predicted metal-dependent enzyme (double-stranded beta helix superfamily)
MTGQNWIVTNDARCQTFDITPYQPDVDIYRLYRFLTDLEDLLAVESDDIQRIQKITPLVRQLLESSYWLQMEFDAPNPQQGWSVRFLYREYGFPLTVQMVAWAPGQLSTIHNHATWGIVALIGGQEKNTLWRRIPENRSPHSIEKVGEQTLMPGDIIGFTPGAIHQVEPIGEEPTVSFNLYGVTNFEERYQFDPITQTARKF